MKKTLKEKIELIKQVRECFSRSSLRIDEKEIIREMSAEEIISSSFEEEFLPLFPYYYSRSLSVGELTESEKSKKSYSFMNIISSDDIFANMERNFSVDNIKKIIDKLLNFLKDEDKKPCIKLNIEKDLVREYFVKRLIETDTLKNYLKEQHYLIDMVNNIMTNGELKTIKLLFEELEKLEKSDKFIYTNFPLVVVNGKLNKEDKISIIKDTYKQKDTHKYTEFIRESITDVNDLDNFIEAIIIQNNRIKEKKTNVIDLLKRIFVGIRGQYVETENILKKLNNMDAFMQKYKIYFDDSTINNFLESTKNNYYQERNSATFIFNMFKDSPLLDKIRIASINNRVGGMFFSRKSKIPKDAIGNEEAEMLFFKYILNNVEELLLLFDDNNFEDNIVYLNKFPDVFKEKMAKTMNFYSMLRQSYYRNDESEKMFRRVIVNMNEKAFDVFLDANAIFFDKLGFNKDERSNWDQYNAKSAYVFLTKGLSLIEKVLKENTSLKPNLERAFFSKFLNDEYLADLTSHLNEVLSDEDSSRTLKSDYKVNSNSDVVLLIKNNLKEVTERLFPEKPEYVQGIEKVFKDLYLLQSLI
jgi:hypothetical protein